MIVPKSYAALIEAVRIAKKNPHSRFPVNGDRFGLTAQEVLLMWRRGVDARASRGLKQLTAEQEQRYSDTQWDALKINEYASRIRHSGCRNLLRTAKLKRRYPHVDNQHREWP